MKIKNKILKKRRKRRNVGDEDEEEKKNEESFWIVCLSSYSTNKSKKVWVQCQNCKLWAHEKCSPSMLFLFVITIIRMIRIIYIVEECSCK